MKNKQTSIAIDKEMTEKSKKVSSWPLESEQREKKTDDDDKEVSKRKGPTIEPHFPIE